FCDEGVSGLDVTNKMARREDPFGFTICDAAQWGEPVTNGPHPMPNPDLELAEATVHRAASVAELADLAGIPADALVATVDELSAALDGGASGSLAVPRTVTAAASPMREPPFRAIPTVPGISCTLGGPMVDARSRVVTPDRAPITGLYAV